MRDMPTINVTNPLQEKAVAVIAVARENDISSTELRAMDTDQRAVLVDVAGVAPDKGHSFSAHEIDRIVGVAAHLWQTEAERTFLERQSAEKRMAPKGECVTCDRERSEGNVHFPAHNASTNCRSGAHNHCTCDACW